MDSPLLQLHHPNRLVTLAILDCHSKKPASTTGRLILAEGIHDEQQAIAYTRGVPRTVQRWFRQGYKLNLKFSLQLAVVVCIYLP